MSDSFFRYGPEHYRIGVLLGVLSVVWLMMGLAANEPVLLLMSGIAGIAGSGYWLGESFTPDTPDE